MASVLVLVIEICTLLLWLLHTEAHILRLGCKMFANFSIIKYNRALSNSVLITQLEVNVLRCKSECMQDSRCKSINVGEDFCQLNEKSAGDYKDNVTLTTRSGWTYMETDETEKAVGQNCQAENKCGAGELCLDSCECPGYVCKDYDECYSKPCLNGGSCINLNDMYACRCTSNYGGTNCERELTNIAEGKQTQQSSTVTISGHQSPSSLAVDGLVNNRQSTHDGFKCAHTMRNGKMPYWRVDFGAEAEIYRVLVYDRNDCCFQRINNFDIKIGNIDGVGANSKVAENRKISSATDQHILKFEVKPPRVGRYLFIESNKNDAMHLCEVVVKGYML